MTCVIDSGLERETLKSAHTSRLYYKRVSVALQQSNAQAILDVEYAVIDMPEIAEHDEAMGVLNTNLLSLTCVRVCEDCDANLCSVQVDEMAGSLGRTWS